MSLFKRRDLVGAFEDRSLKPPGSMYTAGSVLAPYSPVVTDVTEWNALQVADIWACIRALADAISTLPLDAMRDTPDGRVPAGPDARISQLLARPMPGSTLPDLLGQIVTSLNLHGEAFVGKYRSDATIVQLGLLDPASVHVQLKGRQIIYTLATLEQGLVDVGPADVLHVKGAITSPDGLRGLSPIGQCRAALGLAAGLATSAQAFVEQGSRPSGVLTVAGAQSGYGIGEIREQWNTTHAGAENQHKVAVLSGDAKFTPLGLSQEDSQFMQQRELSTREVCRIFRVPAWAIDGDTGSRQTYANVQEQARSFVIHSLRPWMVRIEKAISGDPDLCPGGTFVEFNLDALLRADSLTRAQVYALALGSNTTPGWMSRAEVRALENLNPADDPEAPDA
jgi:HK97 family phage portal protein